MENSYGIAVANRYNLFYDESADPLDILSELQSQPAKKKEEKSVAAKKTKPGPKEKNANDKNLKDTKNKQNRKVVLQDDSKSSKSPEITPKKSDSSESKQRRSENNRGNRQQYRTDDNRIEQNNKFGHFRSGDNRNNDDRPPRMAPRRDNENKRRPPRYSQDGENTFDGIRSSGGFGEKPTEIGTFVTGEFRSDTGEKTFRGRGRGRGGRGGRGRGGYDNRGKREFDRRSGSESRELNTSNLSDDQIGEWNADSTPTDANESKEIIDADLTTTTAAADGEETAEPSEPPVKEMTLDEWKAAQLQEKQRKPEFNIRKPGEGEDNAQWKKMYVLQKKKPGEESHDEETDEEDDEEDYHRGRQKQTIDIQIQFSDRQRGSGRGRGRGFRGGGGSGRGDDRRDDRREDRPFRGGRGVGRGGFARNKENSQRAANLHVEDEIEFPSLGK